MGGSAIHPGNTGLDDALGLLASMQNLLEQMRAHVARLCNERSLKATA
jgi:hypothetical protein